MQHHQQTEAEKKSSGPERFNLQNDRQTSLFDTRTYARSGNVLRARCELQPPHHHVTLSFECCFAVFVHPRSHYYKLKQCQKHHRLSTFYTALRLEMRNRLQKTWRPILPTKAAGFVNVVCEALEKFKKYSKVWLQELPNQQKHGIIIVTSTTGNGDAPENASRFVRYLKRKTTVDEQPFQHCAFAVLGLGDTNYDNFCATGKVVDQKLDQLGGTRAKPLGMADEATGLEDVVEPWTKSVVDDMVKACFSGKGEGTVVNKQEEESHYRDGNGDASCTSHQTSYTCFRAKRDIGDAFYRTYTDKCITVTITTNKVVYSTLYTIWIGDWKCRTHCQRPGVDL